MTFNPFRNSSLVCYFHSVLPLEVSTQLKIHANVNVTNIVILYASSIANSIELELHPLYYCIV